MKLAISTVVAVVVTFFWLHHAAQRPIATAQRAHWLLGGVADSADMIGSESDDVCVTVEARLVGSPELIVKASEERMSEKPYRLFASDTCTGHSIVGETTRLHAPSRIAFNLPWSDAQQLGLLIPRGHRLQIREMLSDDRSEHTHTTPLVLGSIWLALAIAWLFRERSALDVAQATSVAAIIIITIAGAVVVFLLPPAQAPDEFPHFATAIEHTPWQAPSGTAAEELVEGLEIASVRGDPHVHVDVSTFAGAPVTADHRAPRYLIPYANALSYPSVSLSAMLSGPISSSRQALRGYYSARLLALVFLLVSIIVVAQAFGCELSLLFIVFASSPLFLQQATAISTDNISLFLTPVAVAVCAAVRRAFSWPRFLALVALCLFITFCKINSAGVCLLLLTCLQAPHWAWLERRRWLVMLVLLASGVAFVALINRGAVVAWCRFGRAQAEANIRSLTTLTGLRWFFAATWAVARDYAHLDLLLAPLGWLDTTLDPFHFRVLGFMFGAALATDIVFMIGFHRRAAGRVLGRWLALSGTHLILAWLIASYSMFVTWTDPSSGKIEGVQGRYFLPSVEFAALILLLDVGSRVRVSGNQMVIERSARALVLAVLVVMSLANVSLLAIDLLTRYW